MLHDPALSLIWTPEDVGAGTMEEVSASDYTATFTAWAAKAAA